MSLSDKEFVGFDNKPKYNRKDIKQVVKELKKRLKPFYEDEMPVIIDIIDEEMGDKLK